LLSILSFPAHAELRGQHRQSRLRPVRSDSGL